MFGPRSAASDLMHSCAASTTGRLSTDYTTQHMAQHFRLPYNLYCVGGKAQHLAGLLAINFNSMPACQLSLTVTMPCDYIMHIICSCLTTTHQRQQAPRSHQLHDWLIVQRFTSPPTQYRLYGRRFLQVKDPTNSIKVLKENLQKKITQRTKKTQNRHAYTQNVKTNTAYNYNTASPLVYNNMGWLGDSSHRGQGAVP